MQNAFLRQGEEILWETKPEYSMRVFIATLIRASLIPWIFIVAIVAIIGFAIFFKLVDGSLFLMLFCVMIPALPWIGWSLLNSYLQARQLRYILSNQRVMIIQKQPKPLMQVAWSQLEAVQDTLLSDGLHLVQINHLQFHNLRDTKSLLSLIRQHAPHTFIQQTSATDSLEEQLRADEDILWQGKPASRAVHWQELVTPGGVLIFFLLAMIGILSARYDRIFLYGWLLFIVVPTFLNLFFKRRRILAFYSNKLYMISNRRLIIVDSQQQKILWWMPVETLSGFREIQDVQNLYTLDFGYGFVFAGLSAEQMKEITRVLAPYLPTYEKNKADSHPFR